MSADNDARGLAVASQKTANSALSTASAAAISAAQAAAGVASAILPDAALPSIVTQPTTFGANLIPDPTFSGAVTGTIGSGGVVGTKMGLSYNNQLAAVVTANGDGSINLRIYGTQTSGQANATLAFNGPNPYSGTGFLPLVGGADVQASLNLSLVAGTLPPNWFHRMQMRLSGASGDVGFFPFPSFYNFTGLGGALSADTKLRADLTADGYPGEQIAGVYFGLDMYGLSGTVDFTLRIAAPILRTFTRNLLQYVPEQCGRTLLASGLSFYAVGAHQPYSWSTRENGGLGMTERLEVRSGDRDPSDATNVDRSERSGPPGLVVEGVEQWFSEAILIENTGGWQINPAGGPLKPLLSQWAILFQIHPDDSFGTNPPVAIGFDDSGDGLGTRHRIWVTYNRSNPFNGSGQTWNYLWGPNSPTFAELPFGQYVRFVGRVIFDAVTGSGAASTNGRLTIWRDGVQIIDAQGIAVGQAVGNVNSYPKGGTYCQTTPGGQTIVTRRTNVEWQSGVNALASRITAPLPIYDSY